MSHDFQLLERDPEKRLGCLEDKGQPIRRHPFFAPIEWAKLESGQLEPPFKPKVVRSQDNKKQTNKQTN